MLILRTYFHIDDDKRTRWSNLGIYKKHNLGSSSNMFFAHQRKFK